MKKTSLLFLTLFIVLVNIDTALGQSKTTIKNSFVIHAQGLQQADLDFYTKSIEAADFEQFRLQTKTVLLKFKNGFNLELISAKDLVVRNIKSDLDVNSYVDHAATANYKYPFFEVLPSGWITAAVETLTK